MSMNSQLFTTRNIADDQPMHFHILMCNKSSNTCVVTQVDVNTFSCVLRNCRPQLVKVLVIISSKTATMKQAYTLTEQSYYNHITGDNV